MIVFNDARNYAQAAIAVHSERPTGILYVIRDDFKQWMEKVSSTEEFILPKKSVINAFV